MSEVIGEESKFKVYLWRQSVN